MFLSIENPLITEGSTYLERVRLGTSTLLFGMLVVFAVLAVIFLILSLMQACFSGLKKQKKPQAVSAEPPIEATISTASEESADDTAVVAAIIAAISAYTEQAPSSFRVVSFKKR